MGINYCTKKYSDIFSSVVVLGPGFKWKRKCCCKIGFGRNTDCVSDARIFGREWCPS
jgi:hypothetical protein